ncbi:hypothetical protein PAXINDRAFT_14954 [Paxillus involutus ATCC 200175]|uniref:Uncharacterized protein n=1 Tax=Paxillus involutus ATCC 200175 TaxID=664439 RepID=A0A0C9TX40_PAXIN|nr:hypothetical protein PAXINDRAFT_14954 [Paxillus involutus ATCC 200175]
MWVVTTNGWGWGSYRSVPPCSSRLPSFSLPSFASSSLRVFVLRVDCWGGCTRGAHWLSTPGVVYGVWHAGVSWMGWAGRLPLISALSPLSSRVSLVSLHLPYLSPPPLSPCLPFVRAARRYCWGGHACGACPAVNALRQCTVFGVVMGLGWGLVDAKGVDVVGTLSALRRLVVCCSSTLRLSLVFPSPSFCFISLPLPPYLFISPYARAACRYCWGGRACGAHLAVDTWCRRTVSGVLVSHGRGGHVVCPRRLVVCCMPLVGALPLPRLPFSLGLLHLLTFSLPHLFVSPYTRAARQYCWGGRAWGACPAVDAWCRGYG